MAKTLGAAAENEDAPAERQQQSRGRSLSKWDMVFESFKNMQLSFHHGDLTGIEVEGGSRLGRVGAKATTYIKTFSGHHRRNGGVSAGKKALRTETKAQEPQTAQLRTNSPIKAETNPRQSGPRPENSRRTVQNATAETQPLRVHVPSDSSPRSANLRPSAPPLAAKAKMRSANFLSAATDQPERGTQLSAAEFEAGLAKISAAPDSFKPRSSTPSTVAQLSERPEGPKTAREPRYFPGSKVFDAAVAPNIRTRWYKPSAWRRRQLEVNSEGKPVTTRRASTVTAADALEGELQEPPRRQRRTRIHLASRKTHNMPPDEPHGHDRDAERSTRVVAGTAPRSTYIGVVGSARMNSNDPSAMPEAQRKTGPFLRKTTAVRGTETPRRQTNCEPPQVSSSAPHLHTTKQRAAQTSLPTRKSEVHGVSTDNNHDDYIEPLSATVQPRPRPRERASPTTPTIKLNFLKRQR